MNDNDMRMFSKLLTRQGRRTKSEGSPFTKPSMYERKVKRRSATKRAKASRRHNRV